MKSTLLFVFLYIYSWTVYIWYKLTKESDPMMLGFHGERVFLTYDNRSTEPERPHGVVAFVLPADIVAEDLMQDLYGPFGFSSAISIFGYHLYGRDTWGFVQEYQIEDQNNVALRILASENPGKQILLAGVRKIFGRHVWPLDKADKYIILGDIFAGKY